MRRTKDGWLIDVALSVSPIRDAHGRLTGASTVARDIGERLSLSQHTIARHLANARAKLGASNRTEAAMKLDELDGSSPRLS